MLLFRQMTLNGRTIPKFKLNGIILHVVVSYKYLMRKLDCFATKLTAQQCVCEKNFIRLKSLHLVNRRHVNGGDI